MTALATYNGLPLPRHHFEDDFLDYSVSSTDLLSRWFATVNSGTAVVSDSATGGVLTATVHTDQYDLVNIAVPSEAWKLRQNKKLEMRWRLKSTDVSIAGFFVGLSITDTDILVDSTCEGGVTDAVGFMWNGTALYAVSSKDATTTFDVKTDTGEVLVDDTYINLALEWNGVDTVEFFVDGISKVLITDTAATKTNIPDDEDMTPTMEVQGLTTTDGADLIVDYVDVDMDR